MTPKPRAHAARRHSGRILAWKSGTFENLPAGAGPRTHHHQTHQRPAPRIRPSHGRKAPTRHRTESVESQPPQDHLEARPAHARRRGFCRRRPARRPGEPEALGTQAVRPAGRLDAQRADEIARRLGERIEAGPLSHLAANSLEQQMLVTARAPAKSYLVGWPPERRRPICSEKSQKTRCLMGFLKKICRAVRSRAADPATARRAASPWTAHGQVITSTVSSTYPQGIAARNRARRAGVVPRGPRGADAARAKSAFISAACASPPANCAAAPSFSYSRKPRFHQPPT